MTKRHTIKTDINNKNKTFFEENFVLLKKIFLNDLNGIQEDRYSIRILQSAQEGLGRVGLKFHRRLNCLALLYDGQFFALTQHKPCIARNDHRDVQSDGEPLAVGMRPCRTDSGPDTTLLVIAVVVLID
jgi:hypothetical protein